MNNQSQIESEWDVDFGDRKIELVFIGQNLDVKSITKVLEDCLLTKEELIDWKWRFFTMMIGRLKINNLFY